MRDNYSLYSYWDVKNNCFVAISNDFALCRGRGDTHMEAVAALDVEVQDWIKTGRELGVEGFDPLRATAGQEQVISPANSLPQLRKTRPEKPKPKKRISPLKALREALAAAQEAALSAFPLDYTITYDPCLVHVRGEMTLQTIQNARDAILELALHHKNIIVDLTDVPFIDSAGLGILVELRKRLGASPASLCIVVPKGENQIERVLRLGRFDTIMFVSSSLEEAIAVSQQRTNVSGA